MNFEEFGEMHNLNGHERLVIIDERLPFPLHLDVLTTHRTSVYKVPLQFSWAHHLQINRINPIPLRASYRTRANSKKKAAKAMIKTSSNLKELELKSGGRTFKAFLATMKSCSPYAVICFLLSLRSCAYGSDSIIHHRPQMRHYHSKHFSLLSILRVSNGWQCWYRD